MEALTGDRDDPKWFLKDCLSPWTCKETWSDEIPILQELALKNPKGLTIEKIRSKLKTLRIMNRKVTHVDVDMRLFPNLQVLILSGNFLEEVAGEYLPPRVQVLELGFNQLITLEPLLPSPLPNLKYLGLAHNALAELPSNLTHSKLAALVHLDLSFNDMVALDSVVHVLKYLPLLRTLLLVGNPLVLVPGYRGYVVSMLPVLKNLDDRMVQWEERQQYQKWVESGGQFIIDHATMTIEILGVLNMITQATIITSMQTADVNTKDPKKPPVPMPKDEWLYYVEYAYPLFSEMSDEFMSPQNQDGVITSSLGFPSYDSSFSGAATLLDYLSSASAAEPMEVTPVRDRVIHSTSELPWSEMIPFEDTLTVTYTNLRGLKKYFETNLVVRLLEDYIQFIPRGPSVVSVRGDKNKVLVEFQADRLPNVRTVKAMFTVDLTRLLLGESELFVIYNVNKNATDAEIVKENVRELYAAIRDKLRSEYG